MEIDQLGRLRDILEAARLIATYVKNATETDFYADRQKQDAVIRRIEIIGEAAAHVARRVASHPRTRLSKNARHAQHRRPRLCQRRFEDRLGGCHRKFALS
jgi:uncharacterized protein with HEPN domain